MTREEIIAVSKSVAEAKGWPWLEPVSVTRRRTWIFFGRLQWEVMTNAEQRGGNIFLTIDDATGEVVRKGFGPR